MARLASHGQAPAIIDDTETLTYVELARRVHQIAQSLGEERRLVLISGRNSIDAVVAYLAALAGGHVALLDAPDRPEGHARLISTYDPDVVISAGSDWAPTERRSGTAHVLHPDLGLVLSTSGTTGSSRLVRLSYENLQSNAESIVAALGLSPFDSAITTLPLHYCYGLSVVHSHLQCGGSIVLSRRSVSEPSFWAQARQHEVTNFAGVPHTFELLDRAGFSSMTLPSLRFITQAGGRLDPQQVRRWADLGRRQKWDLFVMYGQTEATARMAVLPPALALTHPSAIGLPIPGGQLELAPAEGCAGPNEGELVYRGPNVMMGYAECPEDLSRGASVDALRTGDLARRCSDGTYEIIGRRSRFLKLFGLRVDLDETERLLVRRGIRAICTGDDQRLLVATEDEAQLQKLRPLLAKELGLPGGRIQVVHVPSPPRLPSGKPDYASLLREHPAGTREGRFQLGDIFSRALGLEIVPREASFVSLGGDSLSWVEVSMRLEERIGRLPQGWEQLSIRELENLAPDGRKETHLEMGILLRGVAILLVVISHLRLFEILKGTEERTFELLGGAHVLLAVSGHTFARFLLSAGPPTRRILRSAARVAVPSMLWIAALIAGGAHYKLSGLLLLNHIFGPRRVGPLWFYWYAEALVCLLVVLAALLSVPVVRRAESRSPFVFALTMLAVAELPRFLLFDDRQTYPGIFQPQFIAWIFCAGWAAQRAARSSERLIVMFVAFLAIPYFFGLDWQRGLFVALGLSLLIWVREVPVPKWFAGTVGILAEASFAIYLTQFVVLDFLIGRVPPLAAGIAALMVGISLTIALRLISAAWRKMRSPRAFAPVR